MKKTIFTLFLMTVLLCSLVPSAFAVEDGYVTYTAAGTLTDVNFNVNQIFDDLEPGDVRSYTVHIRNQNSKATRWYMSNEVLSSLETSAAQGGAYSYRLTYAGPSASATLYDSNHVGGDTGFQGRTGLREATEDLENFFFLDTLNNGDNGTVTLTVGLEGETLDNNYQETAGRIRMNFAVEVTDSGNRRSVKTGDENNMLPYYIGMGVAGLLFLYLALDAYTDRKYKKGRAE